MNPPMSSSAGLAKNGAPRTTMNGKPVFELPSRRIINFKSAFEEKLLCDGLTFSTHWSCSYGCAFCYVPSMMAKAENVSALLEAESVRFEDAVIRRPQAVAMLRAELLDSRARRKFTDPCDQRVIYSSPLADVAANLDLVRETIEACKVILELTPWTIRLLSKSNLLPRIAAEIPQEHRLRVVYGVSTGTLDDNLARSFESGTPLVSRRIASLHQLQDAGLRCFGMVCPSLPQTDYDGFSREMLAALRPEKLEHVWAEVINVRGDSMTNTCAALRAANYSREADALQEVSENREKWELYSRATFEAHARHTPAGKLRFLQYATPSNRDWWLARAQQGAVVLGKLASARPSKL